MNIPLQTLALQNDPSSEDFAAIYGELTKLFVECALTCLRHEIASVGGLGCAWQTGPNVIHVRLLCIETTSATNKLLAMVRQLDPEIRIQRYDVTSKGCILELQVKVTHARLERLVPPV